MNMLKRLLAAALLAGVPALYALEGKLFFTLAPNLPDEFANIMPYRPPHIPIVTRCVRHQPVELVLVAAKPAVGEDGKVLVEAESVRVVDPTGKVKEFVVPGKPNIVLKGVKKTKRDFSGVLLSDLAMTMVAEDGDPLGTTRVIVKLRDRGDDSVKELAAEIELVESLPGAPEKPMTKGELSKFISNYHNKPDPAKIPAAFAAFLALDEENIGTKKTYDPLMWLCGFAELYKLNPQLRPALVRTAAECSPVHRQYVALILADAGATDADLKDADPELRRLFDKFRGRSPLSFRAITTPVQLDALWTRFFVTGKVEPIRRLVHELRRRDGVMTVEEMKKLGRKPTPEELRKVGNWLIGGAAEWSLTSNAKQHKLVGFYLESMLMRKQYPDRDAAVKLGRMLIKAGVMEIAEKPGGGKILRPVLRKKQAEKPQR